MIKKNFIFRKEKEYKCPRKTNLKLAPFFSATWGRQGRADDQPGGDPALEEGGGGPLLPPRHEAAGVPPLDQEQGVHRAVLTIQHFHRYVS